jgi:uncharacterized RDD family membrane protein YckC
MSFPPPPNSAPSGPGSAGYTGPAQSGEAQFGEFAPPPAPVEEEDLLGRRIGAALIDLVLLGGLGLILGLTIGEYSFAGPGFTVLLTGTRFLLYLALVLLYYFAAEATSGQTVGKRLLGLRVVRTDGSRPSVGAIAGRTLLRIVDWLPLLYLVGFVVALATGPRRQRVGDLAAKTVVRRAAPGRRRGVAVALLVLVLAAAVGLLAYRVVAPEDTRTYQGHGIRFDYPGSWDEVELGSGGSEGGAQELWNAGVQPPGAGPYDLVRVYSYRLQSSVSPERVHASLGELTELARGSYGQHGGALVAGPQEMTIGGMPAVRFAGTAQMDGIRVTRTDLFVFTGTTEYQLICTAAANLRAEVDRACDQLQRSFTRTEGPTALR